MKTVPCLLLTLVLCGCGSRLASLADTEHGFFANGEVRLRYALDLPKADGPFPVIVLGHGSGRVTAERNAGYAPRLVEHGIAVLRYDKRGVGESGGEYSRAFSNLPVLATDMVAAVEFIGGHPRIDAARIGLMGVSQAGWVIPVAAAKSGDVGSTIILSGPTVTAMQANFWDEQADDESLSIKALSERLLEFRTAPGDFDPRPDLEQMSVPGLWIYGAEDRIIPAAESAAILDELIRNDGKPFTVISHPGADHGLRSVETGEGIDYWTDLLAWFDANTSTRAGLEDGIYMIVPVPDESGSSTAGSEGSDVPRDHAGQAQGAERRHRRQAAGQGDRASGLVSHFCTSRELATPVAQSVTNSTSSMAIRPVAD